MDMSLSELWELLMDREAWRAVIHGGARVRHDWVTELNRTFCQERSLERVSKAGGGIGGLLLPVSVTIMATVFLTQAAVPSHSSRGVQFECFLPLQNWVYWAPLRDTSISQATLLFRDVASTLEALLFGPISYDPSPSLAPPWPRDGRWLLQLRSRWYLSILLSPFQFPC